MQPRARHPLSPTYSGERDTLYEHLDHQIKQHDVIRTHQKEKIKRDKFESKTLPYMKSVGIGVGLIAMGAGLFGLHNANLASRSLSKTMKSDVPTFLKHMELQDAGKGLQIKYYDLPESFKGLRRFDIDVNGVFVQKGGRTSVNRKEVVRVAGEFVPWVLTSINGFPAKTKLNIAKYLVSPTFLFKDLRSKDGMWIKKLLVIGGTPAVKLAQEIGKVIQFVPEADIASNIASAKSASQESFKQLFNPFELNPKKKFQTAKEWVTTSAIAHFAGPLIKGIVGVQDNAPSADSLAAIVKKIQPYMQEKYPNLDLSPERFDQFANASVGQLVTHKDVPGSIFKNVRITSDEDWAAWARVMYGVLTTLPKPVLETVLSNPDLIKNAGMKKLAPRVTAFSGSEDYCLAVYQVCLQMIRDFKNETKVAREAGAGKGFNRDYSSPFGNKSANEFTPIGLYVPKVKGFSDTANVIEFDLIPESTKVTDDPKAFARALYGIIRASVYSPFQHSDYHNGQIRRSLKTVAGESDSRTYLLDFGAFVHLDDASHKALNDAKLLGHLKSYFYSRGQEPPEDLPAMSRYVSMYSKGVGTILSDKRLATQVSSVDKSPLTTSGLDPAKGLTGTNTSHWTLGFGGRKESTFKASGFSNLNRQYDAMSPAEKEASKIITLNDMKHDVDILLSRLKANSSIALNAKQEKLIKENMLNELLLGFKNYTKGADAVPTYKAHKPKFIG